jgi:hypothetical protein
VFNNSWTESECPPPNSLPAFPANYPAANASE